MNQSKLDSIERHITHQARKVLEATPIQEPWPTKQIIAELARQGANYDPRMVQGCLESNRVAGLIREPAPGFFIRITAPPKPKKVAPMPSEIVVEESTVIQEQPLPKKDTLEKLADLSATLRTLALNLDDLAIEVEERIAKVDEGAAKLRQLHQLLKSISD